MLCGSQLNLAAASPNAFSTPLGQTRYEPIHPSHYFLSHPSNPLAAEYNWETYPKNSQKYFCDPEPPLHTPWFIHITPSLRIQEQLPHEGQRTPQSPPCRRRRAQGTAEEEGEVPVLCYTEQDSYAWVQNAIFLVRKGGVEVWR
jgi:hypothetical protein